MTSLIPEDPVNDKDIKKINNFWIGFIIYTLGYTLSRSLAFSFVICQALECIGLIMLIFATANLIHYNIENKYLKIIYILYCLWLLITMMRGFTFNYSFLKGMLFDAWFGMFLYFVPLILLFPQHITFLEKTFNAIIILGFAYVLLDARFIRALLNPDITDLQSQAIVEYFSKTLAIPCGFILLTYSYHSIKKNIIAIIVLLLSFLLGIIRARRGLIFMSICPLVIAYLIYLFNNRGNNIKWAYSLMLVFVLAIYGFRVYNKNKSGLFNSITSRIDQDTRTGVELYFYADMNTNNWIFGKGINGNYYCPDIDNFGSVYRTTIETDYLQIILKGGLISLVLLLLIAIPAIIKGLFLSQNLLSKASAFWILFWVIDLYPATVTTFTLNYVLVWISIGICYSDEIRNIPESKIIKYFKPITDMI